MAAHRRPRAALLDSILRRPPSWGEVEGQVHRTEQAELEPTLAGVSFWQRHFARYRAVPLDQEGLCMW